MTDARQTSFEVPAQMREGAEKSLEQARRALDAFLEGQPAGPLTPWSDQLTPLGPALGT